MRLGIPLNCTCCALQTLRHSGNGCIRLLRYTDKTISLPLVAKELERTVVTLHSPVNIMPVRDVQCYGSGDTVPYRKLDKRLLVTFFL